MQQGARELARLDVLPVTNSLAELQWLAGVAHAWLETAARLVNRLSEDAIRYEGRLHGEMLRAEVALLERSMERVATINSRIAKLDIESRLTTIKERDATELIDAFDATLRALGLDGPDAWRASHVDFASRLRAIHARRQVEPSPWRAIPGETIPSNGSTSDSG
jgi:hypothetical protein